MNSAVVAVLAGSGDGSPQRARAIGGIQGTDGIGGGALSGIHRRERDRAARNIGTVLQAATGHCLVAGKEAAGRIHRARFHQVGHFPR